jgi:hypothetical protein
MRKVLGLTLALLLTATLSAAADEVRGTIKAIDPANNTMVLDDGTTLTVTETYLKGVTPGDNVRAMFETQGTSRVVTGLESGRVGSEARATMGWGPMYGTEMESIQAAD